MSGLTLEQAKTWRARTTKLLDRLWGIVLALEPQELNPDDLVVVDRTLLEIRDWLIEDVEAGKDLRSSKHKRIALYLRLLLCDRRPILILAAKARAVELAAQVKAEDLGPLEGKPLDFSGGDFNWVKLPGIDFGPGWITVGIRDLLSRPVGAIPRADRTASLFTFRDVITKVSQWDGPAHLNLDEGNRRKLDWMGGTTIVGEDNVRQHHIDLKCALLELGEWTIYAIDQVLGGPVKRSDPKGS